MRSTSPRGRRGAYRACSVAACLVIGLLAGGAQPLGAQEPTALTGRVTDAATGDPVPSAMISVTGAGIRTLTAPDGTYRIRGLAAGRYSVEVRSIGYAVQRQEVAIATGGTGTLDFALAIDPVGIEGVGVAVDPRRADPRLAGFWHRKERGGGMGHFFTREDIDRRGARRLSDMFIGLPQARVVEHSQHVGRYITFGRNVVGGDNARNDCPAMLYIDGVPYNMTEYGIDEIHPDRVEAIEVYTGSARVPAQFNRSGGTGMTLGEQFSMMRPPREPWEEDPERQPEPRNYRGDSRCGVIVVWSRTTIHRSR